MTSTLRRVGLMALAVVLGAYMALAVGAPASAQEDDCYPVPPGGCAPEEQEVECADIIAAIAADPESLDADGDGVLDNEALDTNGDGVVDEADLPASCTCQELIDAIVGGQIDGSALPDGALADCGCDELVAGIASGALDPADLPDGLADLLGTCCDQLVDAIVAGDIDASALPDDALGACSCEQVQQLIDSGQLSEDATQQLIDAGVLGEDGQLPEECVDVPEEPEELPEEMAVGGIDTTGLGGMGLAALVAGGLMLAIGRRRTA